MFSQSAAPKARGELFQLSIGVWLRFLECLVRRVGDLDGCARINTEPQAGLRDRIPFTETRSATYL